MSTQTRSIGRKAGILIFISGILVLLFSLQWGAFFLLLFSLLLMTVSVGIICKKLLSASVVVSSVFIILFAAEFVFKLVESNGVGVVQKNDAGVYTGGDYLINYFTRTDIGSQAKPGIHSSVKSAPNGEIIYSANYTIGDDGFRVTPNNRKSNAKKINFFGCSFTFGEGLNDDQTLPFFVAQQSQFAVKNYGFHGYGTQQAYAILTSRRDTGGSINLYLTSPWHAERAACVPTYVKGSPRYVLEEGVVKQQGYCGDGKGSEKSAETGYPVIEKMLGKSTVYNLINRVVSKTTEQNKQLDLYVALIEKMDSLSKARGQEFVVGYIKANKKWFVGLNSNEAVVQRLKSKGIRVIDLTLAETYEDINSKYYIHEIDKHPSSKANEERARVLLRALQ